MVLVPRRRCVDIPEQMKLDGNKFCNNLHENFLGFIPFPSNYLILFWGPKNLPR